MALQATYANPIIGFPVTYGTRPGANGSKGPFVVPLTFQFGVSSPTAANSYNVSLQSNAAVGLDNLQTLYIDNSQSFAETIVTFPAGGESIYAAPFSTGFYPCVTNALTMVVTNNGTPPTFTVNISAYNFIVPPSISNISQLVIGQSDTPVSLRVGTLCSYISLSLANNTPAVVSNGFIANHIANMAQLPYYYITAFNILLSVPAASGSASAFLTLYDSINGTAMNKVFWESPIYQFTTGSQTLVADVDNVMLEGEFSLCLAVTSSTGMTGFATANFYGGITGAQF